MARWNSRMLGVSSEVNSRRMRITSRFSSPSSSRMRLFASTTSAGSMKTVLPVALSSWIIPLSLLFMAGATGITSRPSRRVGATSLSTRPSACAELSMRANTRLTLPSERRSSLRMEANCTLASSFIRPYLSSICSMRFSMLRKVNTPSAMWHRAGWSGVSSSSWRTTSTHWWSVRRLRRRSHISCSSR